MSSIGLKSYETWGDVSEIEIWRVPTSVSKSIVYETFSYNFRPEGIFGELIRLLDMPVHSDYASEGFECGDESSLTVIYRCLWVACILGWVQTADSPKLGECNFRRPAMVMPNTDHRSRVDTRYLTIELSSSYNEIFRGIPCAYMVEVLKLQYKYPIAHLKRSTTIR
jgi:hypothetical protein